MRFAPFACAALWLASPARAGLTWPQKTLSLKADPSAEVVEARYPFTNGGKTPVDIQQVESSCGCTTVELEKRHYEPGESGDIIARFTVGTRVGLQTKTIAVKTNDLPEPVTLTMTVDLPELVRIRPTFVYWMQGDALQPKTMTIEVAPDAPLAELTVQSSNPAMKPVLKEVAKGLRYELTVSPGQTDKVLFSMLTLDCKFGKGAPKTFRAYATVKRKGEPE